MQVRRSRLLFQSSSEVGLCYFGPEARTCMRSKTFCICPFHCKPSPARVSLESPVPENIPHFPGNRAKVGQNHDARKAVPVTLSFLKSTVAIFPPRSSKVSVQKVVLCPFHSRARPSGVTLESARLENIPQVPGNRAEVCQNYDGRKAVSATLSLLK